MSLHVNNCCPLVRFKKKSMFSLFGQNIIEGERGLDGGNALEMFSFTTTKF